MRFRFLLILLFCYASNLVAQEYINKFDVVIEVDTSGDYHITETIEVYATGQEIKRGIYRALPLNRKDRKNKSYPIAYTIESVKKDGATAPFHTNESGGFFNLYVGEQNVFLSPGFYTYEIQYSTYGQVGYFDEFDEIYWNVNGIDWAFPCKSISAKVILPEEGHVRETKCFTGAYGSDASNCTSTNQEPVQFSAQNLGPYENLSIVVAFDKNVVNQPPPPTLFERFRYLIIGIVFGVALLIYYLMTWMKYGVDPPKPAVYPIYEPPENMSPAAVGAIFKDRISDDHISASIVNLAIKGYIQIEEKTKSGIGRIFSKSEYTLHKKKPVDNDLSKEERSIMTKMFQIKDSVVLDGEYQSNVHSALTDYQAKLKSQYGAFLNEGRNTNMLILPILAVILFLVLSFLFGDFVIPQEIIQFLIGGMFFFIFSLSFVIPVLMRVFKKKLHLAMWLIPIIPLGFLIYSFYYLPAASLNLFVLLGFIVFAFFSIVIYKYLIERPSEEKLRLLSLVEGFKMYMGAAEDNQIQHFNPPDMTPEVFERLLPYAIVLDVDKIWGDKFQNFLKSSGAIQEYNRSWYVGNRAFSPDFTHVLQTSVANSVSTTSTKPSESGGGSWSSGSSGGFSGGGGGGGGGGGW